MYHIQDAAFNTVDFAVLSAVSLRHENKQKDNKFPHIRSDPSLFPEERH